ncbi:MAG: hypothetical protein LBU24_01535 [Methanocalculaceae archaeon]|nr:hypothetical protein [Methanocalculaceae archaeon]
MDSISGIIIIADVKTNTIVYTNLAAEQLLHMSRACLRGFLAPNLLSRLGSDHLTWAQDHAKAFHKPENVPEDRIGVDNAAIYILARVLPMMLSADCEYLLTMATDISDEVAYRKRQLMTRELAFVLEGISTTREMWGPTMEMLPKISGFEAIAVCQRSIFDDYVLFLPKDGKFSPVIPRNSIVDRIITRVSR